MTRRKGGKAEPGQLLAGQFQIQRFVAAGGMGEVYLAKDLTLERSVALKLLVDADDGEANARFDREAQLLSSVVHPNVVSVFAYGRHEGQRFLVMEFVEGTSVREYLAAQGRLPVGEAIELARQVAAGLSEAHARGIVHRDVKPGNVLLRHLATGGWLAILADFGLARPGTWADLAITKDSTAAVGTAPYMAPEQIEPSLCGSAGLDAKVDQYALALLVYEMISGHQPFRRDTLPATLASVLKATPPPLHQVARGTGVPAPVGAIIQRAMSRAPEDRFEDVAAFCGALLQFQEGGAKVHGGPTRACSVCQSEAGSDASYCSSCGTGLPASGCLICGARSDRGTYTCGECGSRLLRPSRINRRLSTLVGGELADGTHAVGVAMVLRWSSGAHDITRLLEVFVSTVEREGGRPAALLGREAVALFGLHSPAEADLERALDAALRVLSDLRRGEAGSHSTRVGLGVELGGLSTAGAGSAWGLALGCGEAVATARAVAGAAMAASDERGVGVGPRADRMAQSLYDRVAGGDGLTLVTRRGSQPWRNAIQRVRGEQPMLGREFELAQLLRSADTVRRTGELRVVPVIGPAGAGKTRLVTEALQTLSARNDGWYIDSGRCSPTRVAVAYEPFSQMLAHRIQLHQLDSAELAMERLAALPGVSAEQTTTGAGPTRSRCLLRLMSVVDDSDALEPPPGEHETRAAFDALAAYVEAVTRSRPMVLLVEDAQWVRPTTLDLLDHLVRRCREAPVLVVMPLRESRADEVLGSLDVPPRRLSPIDLAPLDDEAARTLLRDRLPEEPPQDVLDTMLAFAGGNPAHLEEAVWALSGPQPLSDDRPTSGSGMRPLVVRRLQELPAIERRVLEAVAVAGRSTPQALLEAMLDGGLPADVIEGLVGKGLLVEARSGTLSGQLELTFRQRNVEDIVLDLVKPALRRRLHARAARWLLTSPGRPVLGRHSRLAEHFLGAGDLAEAATGLLDAAREATRAYAVRDAFELYGLAGEVAGELAADAESTHDVARLRADAALGRARLGHRIGEHELALEAASEADTLGTSVRGGHYAQHARCVAGEVLEALGRHDEAVEAFSSAADVSGDQADPGLALYAVGRHAMTLYKMSRLEEAAALARDAVERAPSVPLSRPRHRALASLRGVLGHVASRAGRHEEAHAAYAVAEQHCASAGDELGAVMLALSMGNVAFRAGDLRGAGEVYDRAFRECERLGYLQGSAIARHNLGEVLVAMGRHREALRVLEDAEAIMRRIALVDYLALTLKFKAQAAMTHGSVTRAVAAAAEAAELAVESGQEELAGECEELHRRAVALQDDPTAPASTRPASGRGTA